MAQRRLQISGLNYKEETKWRKPKYDACYLNTVGEEDNENRSIFIYRKICIMMVFCRVVSKWLIYRDEEDFEVERQPNSMKICTQKPGNIV